MILLVVLAAFVLGAAARTAHLRQQRTNAVALARDTTMIAGGQHQGIVHREAIPSGAAPITAPAEMRRRVRSLSPGTYIDDILAVQDSALYRWPERLSDALRVYVEPSSTIAGWNAQLPAIAQGVFSEWSQAGFPLRFTFIFDTTSADITIRWVDRFPSEEGQRIGVTERLQTSAFQIARARVQVASRDSLGRSLSPTVMGGILRHEIGHALGLNHANDPSSVMYRESATAQISASDRATLRLLYLIPPGSLR